MRAFKYTVRSTYGAEVEGVIEANTLEEAVSLLKDEGYIVQDIEQSGGEHDINLKLGSGKTKDKDLSVMCNQFAIILEAGLPIVRSLELVAGQTDNKDLKQTLIEVSNDVAAGYELASSFEKHGKTLPSTFIESIRAGEQSGNLTLVFHRMSDFYRKQSETSGKVRSALVYPSFVMVVAVIVVGIIMVFAVPTFKTTFDSLGQELPLPTKALIATSDFFTKYWWLVIIAIGVIVAGFKMATRYNEDFRLRVSEFATRMPVVGNIIQMSSSSQYASTMSVMMAAGLSSSRAVEVTSRTVGNFFMGRALSKCIPDLEAGKPLADSLASTHAFPQLVTEMTGVGEQTGELEHTLDVVSDYYDFEVQEATSRAISLLEPAIICVLAVVVVWVLLAVYLPMFSMYGAIDS